MMYRLRIPLLLTLFALFVSLTLAQSGVGNVAVPGADDDEDEAPQDVQVSLQIIDDAEEVQAAIAAAATEVNDPTSNGLGDLANILDDILVVEEEDELTNEALLQAFAALVGDEDLNINEEGVRNQATQIAKVQISNLRTTLETVNITAETDLNALTEEQIQEVLNITEAFIATVQNTLTQTSIADNDPEVFEKRAAISALLEIVNTASISARFNLGTAANPLTIGGFARPLAQAPTYVYDAASLVGGAAGLVSYVYNEDNFSVFSEGIFPIGSNEVTYTSASSGSPLTVPLRVESVIFTDFAVVDASGSTVELSGEQPFFHVIELSDILPANRILIERYDETLGDYVLLPILGDRVTNTVLYTTYSVDALNYSFVPLITGTGESGLIVGTAQSEVLRGGPADEELRGGAGNDILRGLGGDDALRGEEGNDFLVGGDGNDFLVGGPGNDIMILGSGNDTFEAGGGTDQLYGPDLRLLMALGNGAECEAIDISEGIDGSITGVCRNGIAHTFRASADAPFVPFGQ